LDTLIEKSRLRENAQKRERENLILIILLIKRLLTGIYISYEWLLTAGISNLTANQHLIKSKVNQIPTDAVENLHLFDTNLIESSVVVKLGGWSHKYLFQFTVQESILMANRRGQ